METLKALSTLYAVPSTYTEINNAVIRAEREAQSGDYHPLDIEILLKSWEEFIKQLRASEKIKELAVNEALKYGKGQFTYRGVKMSVREGGVKYDYASSGDSTWALLQAQAEELAEKKKAREKFLQSLPPEGIFDATTSEHVTPPAKSSKTTIAVSLAE